MDNLSGVQKKKLRPTFIFKIRYKSDLNSWMNGQTFPKLIEKE